MYISDRSALSETPVKTTFTVFPPRSADVGQVKVTVSPSLTWTLSDDVAPPLWAERVMLLHVIACSLPWASTVTIFFRTA